MKRYRILRVALIAAFLAVATLNGMGALATSFSLDQSDMWSANGEPGWAIQLVQRGDAIFATMYVYGHSGQPTFYTATLESTQSLTWSGDLIATTGPWFGAMPFNPALVTRRIVGTMTWTATGTYTGTLDYSVDGLAVSKDLARFLIRYEDYSGTYFALGHTDVIGCSRPPPDFASVDFMILTIAQRDRTVTIRQESNGGTCSFNGTLFQFGRFGVVEGTYTCTTGDFGTFQFYEMTVGLNYLTGRFDRRGTNDGCDTFGYFAAMRPR